ncbi:MAG: GGDEF domain-containing protein [Sideroxydans sp.]|nr:GGDEF domain-containing protein [Sideroxydans sp.]
MPDPLQPSNVQALQAEITRLNKIVQALMNRAERNASLHGSDFNLFQTAITLEDQVQRRTGELEAALQENEKITRTLRERESNYRLLLENSPVSVHEIGLDGKIISMSRAGLVMHGVKDEDEVRGALYLDGVGAADRERIAQLLDKAYNGETSHFEFVASGSRGRIFKSCFVPLKDRNGNVEKLMGITEDITERKQAEEQVRHLAFYDALTQLANRRLLTDRLGLAMAASKRSGRYGALMFLDLDNFKPLNDTHGHEAGDLLLIEVAQRLTRCVRAVDTVARIGGDEFVVMVSELHADKEISFAQAGAIAEKIRVALAAPYFLERNFCALPVLELSSRAISTEPNLPQADESNTVEHHCTASIGVVLFINHESSHEDILKWADSAMYQAKESGRNRIRFYEQ